MPLKLQELPAVNSIDSPNSYKIYCHKNSYERTQIRYILRPPTRAPGTYKRIGRRLYFESVTLSHIAKGLQNNEE